MVGMQQEGSAVRMPAGVLAEYSDEGIPVKAKIAYASVSTGKPGDKSIASALTLRRSSASPWRTRLRPRFMTILMPKACRRTWNVSFTIICNVASWRTAFYVWDVTPARKRSCWPLAVSEGPFALRVRAGAWPRPQRTWSRACAPCNTAWYPRFKRVELGGRF
jgi:hypothetical protein